MSLLPILIWPDPRLSTPCEPVGAEGVTEELIRDLFETMYDAPGRGLAAPQVGVMQRVFVMDAGWKDGEMTPRACIDPEITWRSDETGEVKEGCLSIPEYYAEVPRALRVKLKAQGRDGEPYELEADGLLAHCIQHELDHLEGVLFVDYLSPLKRDRVMKKMQKRHRQMQGA